MDAPIAKRFCISPLEGGVVNLNAPWASSILKWPGSKGVDLSKTSWRAVPCESWRGLEFVTCRADRWFTTCASLHQQPEVNFLPRFGPQLISLEECSLRLHYSREIDLRENLDIVHITLPVAAPARLLPSKSQAGTSSSYTKVYSVIYDSGSVPE